MDDASVAATKRCSKCEQDKPASLEFFSRDSCRRDGLQSRCKNCQSIRSPESAARLAHRLELASRGIKVCNGCDAEKPATVEFFSPDLTVSSGLEAKCRVCRGKGRTANRRAQGAVPLDRPDEERFWEKVDKNGPVPEHRPELGPCHVWTGALSDAGYGLFWLDGRQVRAHRYALFLARGLDPRAEDDTCGLHHCDNKPCVRDSHLFTGSRGDNAEDRHAKGRDNRGEDRPCATLSNEDVREIRSLLGKVSHTELGKRFGVRRETIGKIARGERWQHLP